MHFHNREKVIEIERTEITSVNPGKENIIYIYPSEMKGNASRPINCNDISIRDEIIESFHQSLSGTRMCFHFYSPNYIDLILWFKAFGMKVNIKRTVLGQRCVFVGSERSQTQRFPLPKIASYCSIIAYYLPAPIIVFASGFCFCFCVCTNVCCQFVLVIKCNCKRQWTFLASLVIN